jgi:hypothetical protein
MRYFDQFETRVQADGVAVPLYFETRPNYECVNAPEEPRIDLHEFDRALTDAQQLDDQLDDLSSKIKYMNDVASGWNPATATPAVINDLSHRVSLLQRKLRRAVDDLAYHTSRNANLPFTEDDLPELPSTWVLRQLKSIPGFPYNWTNIIDQAGEGATTYTATIPRLNVGAPVQITASYHFTFEGWGGPHWGEVHSFIKKSDGTRSKLFSDWRLERHNENSPTETKIVQFDNDLESFQFDLKVQNGAIAFAVMDVRA